MINDRSESGLKPVTSTTCSTSSSLGSMLAMIELFYAACDDGAKIIRWPHCCSFNDAIRMTSWIENGNVGSFVAGNLARRE